MSRRAAGSTATSKAVVGLVVTTILGGVGYAGIYLPFYSQQGKERAEKVATGQITGRGGGAPGSYWKNLDAKAKEAHKHHHDDER